MGWADGHISLLQGGVTVKFRPRGNSMVGKISSGDLCTVEPLGDHVLKTGDVVLCRVGGNQYLHLVKAIQGGWVTRRQIFGRLIAVEP